MHVTVDFGNVNVSKDIRMQVHELLKAALKLPDYYGCNLDALYDVLLDPHEQWNIRFLNCRKLWQQDALFMESLRETFSDAEAEGSSVSAEWFTLSHSAIP